VLRIALLDLGDRIFNIFFDLVVANQQLLHLIDLLHQISLNFVDGIHIPFLFRVDVLDQLAVLHLQSVRAFLGQSTVLIQLGEINSHKFISALHILYAFLIVLFETFDQLLIIKNFLPHIVTKLLVVSHACYEVHAFVD